MNLSLFLKTMSSLLLLLCSGSALAQCWATSTGGSAYFNDTVQITRSYFRGEVIKDLGWKQVELTSGADTLYCNTTSDTYQFGYSDGHNMWPWISGLTNVMGTANPGIGIRTQLSMQSPSIPALTLSPDVQTGRFTTIKNTTTYPVVSMKVELIATGEPITTTSLSPAFTFGLNYNVGNTPGYMLMGFYFPMLYDVRVIPQLSCTITGGNQNIELDPVYAAQLQTRGTTGQTEKTVNIGINCNNVGGAPKTQLKFQGAADPNDANALKTSNGNVGIRVKDVNNNILKPNQSKIPVASTGNGQNGTATIKLTPINTTGNIPGPGTYSSTATLVLEYK